MEKRHAQTRLRAERGLRAPVTAVLLAALALGIAAAVSLDPITLEQDVGHRPIEVVGDGFVSSDGCRACHPSQYATWHGSFHRTMTQIAGPDTVRADFDGVVVQAVHGRPMHLERRGDEFWATFDDPGWQIPDDGDEPPRITKRVVMITGSHHQNIYWYATEHDRALNVLPAVYLLADERWAPRSAVVLHPPGQGVATTDGHWNAICIACHTTHGKTQFDSPFGSEPIADQRVETTVAEFGIACESCHGPADEHLRTNSNPFVRYVRYFTDEPDPTIAQPARLDPGRSSQVCGQCHSIWEFAAVDDERRANSGGLPYRPGDALRDTRFLVQPSVDNDSPDMVGLLDADPDYVRGSFWPDGMVRVSGREYNGLIDSPCYVEAETVERTMTCFSCHTMHKTDADPRSTAAWADTHQVSAGMDGDAACVQCHGGIGQNPATHTNHAADSAGSRCYNCHMPYTSYGLLKAVRSHTVSSPSVHESVDVARPNACNLCHLDRTLAWTGDHLARWYDLPTPPLDDDERSVAASLLWLLRGDAGVRAITAWSYGWSPARTAAGTDWMTPFLGELLGDPYDAVRFIAGRSLGSLPEHANLDYDFVGEREARLTSALGALGAWERAAGAERRRDPELLFSADGSVDIARMRRLFGARDTRPLFLRE